jgi:hypothetical protein
MIEILVAKCSLSDHCAARKWITAARDQDSSGELRRPWGVSPPYS